MLKARLIRIKVTLALAWIRINNSLSPSARQDNLGVAIEVVTDKPVREFLLKALEIASGKFIDANSDAGVKATMLDVAKQELLGAEQVRATRAKQLEAVVSVVDKQK